MTITCSALATGTLETSRNGFVSANALPTVQSEASAATPAVFYDSSVTENTSASVWNQYEISVGTDRAYTLENLSSSQTLSGNTVSPVGSGGVGRIRVSDGVVSQILKCDTRVTAGGTYREFVEYESGSISRYLYDQIGALFDVTLDVEYFSTYNHATSTYTRNAACWAASIDLSCVAVASNSGSGWMRQRCGTLITPRHILIARHYAYGVGTQVRFSDAAGTVETRTVIGTSAASVAGDLRVCTLSAAVTLASPCAIAGTWIMRDVEYLDSTIPASANYYFSGLMMHITQNARVYAATLGSPLNKIYSPRSSISVNGSPFPNFLDQGICDHDQAAIPIEFAALRSSPASGDSGQPAFVLIEGDPVLLWCWYSANGGPPAYQSNGAVLNALIVVSNDNAVTNGHARPTDHTVTVAPDPTL